MKKSDLAVGDRVVVREWDDMVEEFGLDKDLGEIPCKFNFVPRMREFCGMECVVNRISGNLVTLYDVSNEFRVMDGWSVSADMLKLADDVLQPPDSSEFDSLILNF